MLEHIISTAQNVATRLDLIAYILSALLACYVFVLIITRLYLSPIANVPGSRLAAVTMWYETYYDILKGGGGQFVFEYQRWHKEFGPIVRISPTEVHIQDPEYFEEFYRKPYDKLERLQRRVSTDNASFSTPDHSLHKRRRAALNPFFSRQKIAMYSPVIQEQVNKLCGRLSKEFAGTGRVVVLNDAYGCLTSDLITKYCFERTYDFLDIPDFKASFLAATTELLDVVHYMEQFPWLESLSRMLPDRVVCFLSPSMAPLLGFHNEMTSQIGSILDPKSRAKEKEKSHDTLFKALLHSDHPAEDKTLTRLQQEAISVTGAGLETTRWTLSVASFYLLSNPPILARLREELITAIPENTKLPSLTDLQRLPYLTACIEESLRLSGVSQRSVRSSRTESTVYGDYVLPPGTEISMSTFDTQFNEQIFPEPIAFRPERWLGDPKGPDGQKPLRTYLTTFGKGHRMCAGLNLAYAELYITLSTVFRTFDMRLFETTYADVAFYSDMTVPRPKKGSKGVRVVVEGTL